MTSISPCEKCGADVHRNQLADDHPFAKLAARLPVLCDECCAQAEREDYARQQNEAREREAREIADRVKRSGLPRTHWHSPGDLDHLPAVCNAAEDWAAYGGGLLLTGDIGRGKTTIAGAACWARLQTKFVLWTSAPLLMARLGAGLGTEERDWALDALAGRHGLVLDDIDKARPTEYGAEQIFLAIDQRVEHGGALLVTANLSPSELADRWPEPYGDAIASRLVGYCKVILVDGNDRRLNGGVQ